MICARFFVLANFTQTQSLYSSNFVTEQDVDGCVWNGKVIAHGDTVDLGPCESCFCNKDSTISCETTTCPPVLHCDDEDKVKFEDSCCDVCPCSKKICCYIVISNKQILSSLNMNDRQNVQ